MLLLLAGAVHADGVYYPPSGGPAVPVPREPCDPITALLQELEVCEGKTASLMPSQKVLTWPGVEAVQKKPVWRPPKVSLDQGRRSSVSRRSSASLDLDILQAAAEGGDSEEARADRSCLRTSSCMRTPPRPGKKQGETISKGHRNYELMLNLQLGIRCLSVLLCFVLAPNTCMTLCFAITNLMHCCFLNLIQIIQLKLPFIFWIFGIWNNTGTLSEGSQRQLRWISSHQHLIQRRRCGQDFLLKDQSILLLTNHVIFGGKTTAPWFSGLSDDLYMWLIINLHVADFFLLC